ncbi:Trafficking protein particle complex subunit 13, partial [Coemansia asiatica]
MASLLRESHPLTLKVMRLSKPSLADTQVLPVDSADSVLSQALRDIEQNNPTQSGAVFSSDVQASEGMAVLDALPLSETLVLPRAFGTMYLGETFGAHLCICNESTLAVREILVQISMQTTTQQVPL